MPLADWNKLQERITETKNPTARLEASGWAALGGGISFLAASIALPFNVEWSTVINNAEHINWAPLITEGMAIFLALLFLGYGALSLYWAGVKQKLQSKMGEWIVQDMKSFHGRHSQAGHSRSD